MKSSTQYQFSQVPGPDIERSTFNRTHTHKTTFDSGYLVPFLCDEVVPGDTFNARATIFARLQTQKVPIMDNIYMDTFYFFIPNRLVWDHWVNLCGERLDPDDDTEFITPVLSSFTVAEGDLGDHLGLPLGTYATENVISALFFRAYNLVYNEWFRDQNLIDHLTFGGSANRDDGPDAYSQYALRRRGKRHDYFTSAATEPQKGDAIELPLGATAPVIGNGRALGLWDGHERFSLANNASDLQYSSLTAYGDNIGDAAGATGLTNIDHVYGVDPSPTGPNYADSGLIAVLSTATAATINEIREAFQLQKMLERDMRGGTRYTEIVRAHFGVVSPDARLQRPEYLGGSSARMIISPVSQTSASDLTGSATKLGSLAAYATCADSNGGFYKSFTEHGIILGIANVRADLTYQQGIPKKFLRSTRYDYYWPALAHLGEQAILNKEIYHQDDASTTNEDNAVFGYQERFAEYRYFPNEITGTFRSTAATPLDAWHLAQEFADLPVLGQTFIEENPPIDRIVAVTTEPEIFFDSVVEMKCHRPMPVYSVPGLLDHF